MSICIEYELQKKVDGKWIQIDPQLPPVIVPGYTGNVDIVGFNHYPYYHWLNGNIRRGYDFAAISEGRGLPDDYPFPEHDLSESEVTYWTDFLAGQYGNELDGDWFGHSWLMLDEIINFDFDAQDGGYGSDGTPSRYRDWIGEDYINEFKRFKSLGAERMVFWFRY